MPTRQNHSASGGDAASPCGALHGTGSGATSRKNKWEAAFAQITPDERQVGMKPIAMVRSHPTLLYGSSDCLLTRKMGESHGSFGPRDGSIGGGVQIRAEA